MAATLTVNSRSRTHFINITSQVQDTIPRGFSGIGHLFCQHTTAGLTINENADPDVVRDVETQLDEMVPWDCPNYQHMEGNSAAHIKSSLIGPSLTVPIEEGKLLLGTWQSIYFCEFDGPRSRRVILTLCSSGNTG